MFDIPTVPRRWVQNINQWSLEIIRFVVHIPSRSSFFIPRAYLAMHITPKIAELVTAYFEWGVSIIVTRDSET